MQTEASDVVMPFYMNKSFLVLIAVIAIITAAGAIAYSTLVMPAAYTPVPCSQSTKGPILLCVHVVSGGGKPLEGKIIGAGPANSTNDVGFYEVPGPAPPPTLKQCIGVGGGVPSGAIIKEVGNERIVIAPNGSEIKFPKPPLCPMARYRTNSDGWALINRTSADYYLIIVSDSRPPEGPLSPTYRYDVLRMCPNKNTIVTLNVVSGTFDVTCSR